MVTIITDSFTAPNGTAATAHAVEGGSKAGTFPTLHAGVATIEGNQLRLASVTENYISWETSALDVTVSGLLSDVLGECLLMIRCTDSSNFVSFGGRILKTRVNGNWTDVGYCYVHDPGSVTTVRAIGTTFAVFADGVQLDITPAAGGLSKRTIEITTGVLQTGTRAGFQTQNAAYLVDDLLVIDAQPPAPRQSVDITELTPGAWIAPASSASISPVYPAGLAEGDAVFAVLQVKPDTATVSVPFYWVPVVSAAGGGGTQGAGTGAMKTHLFKRTVGAGGLTGSETFTVTGGSSMVGHMRAVRGVFNGAANPAYEVESTSYSRTTASTTYGGTGAAGIDLAPKDHVYVIAAAPDDQASAITISAVTATGATLSTIAQDPAGTIINAQGNDIAAAVAWLEVTSGTSTAAPAVTATSNSSETGMGFIFRVRATADVTVALPNVVMAPPIALRSS